MSIIFYILYSESRNNPKKTIYKGYPAPADTGHRFQVTDEWGFNIIEKKWLGKLPSHFFLH